MSRCPDLTRAVLDAALELGADPEQAARAAETAIALGCDVADISRKLADVVLEWAGEDRAKYIAATSALLGLAATAAKFGGLTREELERSLRGAWATAGAALEQVK